MTRAAFTLSEHARIWATRRGIAEETVVTVASKPEQIIPQRPGREIRQSRVGFPPTGKVYLVRAVVELAGSDMVVVTVYRTSKLEKYWRKP